MITHSFLYLKISFYSALGLLLLTFFSLLNSVPTARNIKIYGVQLFSRIPGLLEETDKSQPGVPVEVLYDLM